MDNKNRSKELINSSIILSIGTFLPKLASFVILPILTGYLTKEEYGSYDLIVVLASLILPAATLQIQTAAFRFLITARGKEREQKKIITNIFLVLIPVSIVMLAIVFFLFPSDSVLLRTIVCIYFFADAIYGALGQIARGLARNMDYSLGAIINSTGNVLFLAILVMKLGNGLTGAVFTLFAAYTIASLFIAFRIRIHRYIDLNAVDIPTIKKMLAYSWPMVPNAMSMWVMRASDRFVISIFMGVTANAIYAAANKVPSILTLAQTVFAMAWTENASVSVNDPNVGEYSSDMFKKIFSIMAGFMAFLIGGAPIIFSILIRGDYSEALDQIPILLMALLFFALSSFMGGIYVAFLQTRSVGITTIVAAAINLIVDISTIRWIGLYAASGSTLVSYIVLFLYRSTNIRKFVDIKYDIKYMCATFAFLVFQIALYYRHNFWITLANMAIGAAFFIILNRDTLGFVVKKLIKKVKK